MDSKSRKLKFVGYSIEHKAYRFVDCETDLITISRDARFLELGNGTSTVEFSTPSSSDKQRRDSVEEEIKLLPIKEEFVEGDDVSDAEDYEDAEDEDLSTQRDNLRPHRNTRSVAPRHLEDYVLDYTVGTAACAAQEPVNYQDALKVDKWHEAMKDELESHRRNNTWELVPLPKGQKLVGAKWVFKLKRNEEGQIVKHKARVVAQGHVQRYGTDFEEVYAPVTRHATFRTFLTVAAKRRMSVKHLDIKTAYLYGVLEEEVYMRQPPGFEEKGKENLVCRLHKSIYGLRQSARCWNKRLHDTLTKLGFKPSRADQCLYVKDCGHTTVFLLVYVDDMLVASTDDSELQKVFRSLNKEFELTCLGDVRHFLGMEVQRVNGAYNIRLQSYIEELLKLHGMSEAKPAKTPMDPGYLKDETESKLVEDVTKYRSVVGSLLYLSVVARPDIANSAAILGRKLSNPTELDWTAAKRVLRYLKGTKNYNLRLGGMLDEPLSGYSDADWAGDVQSRRSTSGYVFMFGGATITWASRGQSSVTLSSMEAEYVALSEACQEAIWLRQLLADFGEHQTEPTTIREDNQGCLAFVRTERSTRRSKHIDTREKFIQELCLKKKIALEYCSTELMTADVLTKPLGPNKHARFCGQLGLE